jgi:hypothetical protein
MPRPDGTTYTNFYFDAHGSCKDPGQAIAYLQADQYSPTYLSQFYPNLVPGGTIQLGNSALLMMGITDELQAALRRDYKNGQGIVALQTAGWMRIWYVRRRVWSMPPETKTVVIIASWTDYWGHQSVDLETVEPYFEKRGDRNNWFRLWPAIPSGYSMSLGTLAEQVLPTVSSVPPWW